MQVFDQGILMVDCRDSTLDGRDSEVVGFQGLIVDCQDSKKGDQIDYVESRGIEIEIVVLRGNRVVVGHTQVVVDLGNQTVGDADSQAVGNRDNQIVVQDIAGGGRYQGNEEL